MTTPAKKRTRGRPRRERKTSLVRLVARCTEVERRAAEKAAEKLGETLSDFVRQAVAISVRIVAGQAPGDDKLALEFAEWIVRNSPGRGE